jgi:hypothetical protein
MSETNNFSRRFLAEFIAARLRAMRVEKDAPQRTAEDPNLAASPRAERGSISISTDRIHSLKANRRFSP